LVLVAGCAQPPSTVAPVADLDLVSPSGTTAPAPTKPPPAGAGQTVSSWFTDVTAASGVTLVGAVTPPQQPSSPFYLSAPYVANGATAGDVDGDGRIDLVIAGGFEHPAVLYRNLGGLRFEAHPLDGTAIGVALADLDNDGDPDLILADADGCAIYENVAGVLVRRVTLPGFGAVGALPVDLDGDGRLDVYFYAHAPQLGAQTPGGRLLHNRGGFDFDDVTAAWGLTCPGIAWAAAAFDWDGDGAPELYIANDTGVGDSGNGSVGGQAVLVADALFHGTAGAFTDVAAAAHLQERRSSMNVLIEDFDGDGRFDLFISNWGRNRLLLASEGIYVNDIDQFGLGEAWLITPRCPPGTQAPGCLLVSWGAARFDADHDGWDDLMIVRGNVSSLPDVGELQPAAVWQGGAGGLNRIDGGLGWLAARSLIPVDLDGDGDLDLVITQHGAPVRIFRNNAPADRGWLLVRLGGTHSNRDGIGATVTATLASGRQIRRLVGAGGQVHGFAPPEAHFTTGGEPMTSLEVRWPSGTVQQLTNVSLDQIVTIAEP
jgi:hypothetical protein